MARYMLVGVLLALLCAANVLAGPAGPAADKGSSGAPRAADAADAAPEADDASDHVRDKRRLPDPGFIIPATPMGFSKNGQPAQQAQQTQPQEARSSRQPTSAPSTASQAERKVSSSSSLTSSPSSPSSSLTSSPSSAPGHSSHGPFPAQTRQKKAPARPVPGSREAPLGREEHVRALTSFLSQTRKLGVPDEQALKLLDKELAKAKRQGPTYRPVYHATPLKPYGSLINFNQTPYEKHQLKNMKPIKEQQNDIPPPSKPIVVESDRQVLGAKAAKATPSPIPGQHTEALVAPNGPLPVSVPKQIGPLHLLQTSQKLNSALQHSSPQILSGPLSGPQQAYQTISLPVAGYKQEETYQTQLLDNSQYLQATPIEQTMDSETPVSLEAMHSYPVALHHNSYPAPQHSYSAPQHSYSAPQHSYSAPQHNSFPVPEQHEISASIQHEPLVSTVASPQVTVEEVHQPVYVYRQEEVKIPQPQAEVHVELPAKQVIHEPVQHSGLYHDQKEQPEEYASQYRFGYRVRDQHAGNDFGHAETRDGKMTKGEYFVTLPDGRLQSVKYWADKGGYHAQISYTNHATHPAPAAPALATAH